MGFLLHLGLLAYIGAALSAATLPIDVRLRREQQSASPS